MEVSLVLSGHTNFFWEGTASYIFNRKWFQIAEDSKIVNKGKELSLQNKKYIWVSENRVACYSGKSTLQKSEIAI